MNYQEHFERIQVNRIKRSLIHFKIINGQKLSEVVDRQLLCRRNLTWDLYKYAAENMINRNYSNLSYLCISKKK